MKLGGTIQRLRTTVRGGRQTIAKVTPLLGFYGKVIKP